MVCWSTANPQSRERTRGSEEYMSESVNGNRYQINYIYVVFLFHLCRNTVTNDLHCRRCFSSHWQLCICIYVRSSYVLNLQNCSENIASYLSEYDE